MLFAWLSALLLLTSAAVTGEVMLKFIFLYGYPVPTCGTELCSAAGAWVFSYTFMVTHSTAHFSQLLCRESLWGEQRPTASLGQGPDGPGGQKWGSAGYFITVPERPDTFTLSYFSALAGLAEQILLALV